MTIVREAKDNACTSFPCNVIAHSSLQSNDPRNYQEATAGLERHNERQFPLKCNHKCVKLSTIRKVATCTDTGTRPVRSEHIEKGMQRGSRKQGGVLGLAL